MTKSLQASYNAFVCRQATKAGSVAVVAAVVVLLLFASPTRAGWTISYAGYAHFACTEGGQTTTYDYPANSGGNEADFATSIKGDTWNNGSIIYTGNYTAKLTWVGPDGLPADPASAPASVTVLESDVAQYQVVTDPSMSGSGSVDDGAGDSPSEVITQQWPPDPSITFSNQSCSGYHVQTLSPTGGVVSLPQVTLTSWAAGSCSDPLDRETGSVEAGGSYTVEVVNPCTVSASSTASPVDARHPYFSGTDCTATGTANIPNSAPASWYIDSAKLIIGGTVVNSYQDDGVNHLQTVSVSAYFDSTHFGDGADVDLEMMATDSQGNKYGGKFGEPTDGSTPFKPKAYNKAFIGGNNTLQDFQTKVTKVEGCCAASQITPAGFEEADQQQIAEQIPRFTVFYFFTHSSPDTLGDCYYSGENDATSNAEHLMSTTPFTNALTIKARLGMPPYTFAEVDGCNSAGSADVAFTDWRDAFGISGSDSCYIGWRDYVYGSDRNSEEWQSMFWQSLSCGQTVASSVLSACATASEVGTPDESYLGSYFSSNVVPDIQGDYRSKIHGVYGVSSSLQWYR